MTTRLLPPSEWPRLHGTLLGDTWPHLDPQKAGVLAVEDDAGTLVGCVAVFPVWHVEGVWIDQAHRSRVSVARAIVRGLRMFLAALGVGEAWMMATTPEAGRMIRRVGEATPLTCDHYAVRMR